MKRTISFHSNAVWPSLAAIAVFVVVYGLFEGALQLIYLMVPHGAEAIAEQPEIRNVRLAFPTVAAAVYAIFRLWRFHPACSPAYAGWLKLSPWTADKPLPLGPVHPVWQDAVVIGALAAITKWHAQSSPAVPVAVFGLIYLAGMTMLLAHTRRWGSCVVLGFLWPTLILPCAEGVPMIMLVAAIAGVIWHGYRKSLRAFPWDYLPGSSPRPASSLLQTEIRLNVSSGSPAARPMTNVGWPFLALSPKVHCSSVSRLVGLALGAQIGWGCFCAIQRFEIPPMTGLILTFASFAALIRLGIYCSGLAAPFNLWGRIATGRIVLPQFDRVLLTPFTAVMVAMGGEMIIRRSGAWYPVTQSVVIALILGVLLTGGPTLRNWVLTGQHRFRIPTRPTANKQFLRPV